MSPWLMLGAVLAIGAAYVGGRIDGAAMERSGQLRAERRANEVRIELQDEKDVAATAAETREIARAGDVREIYRETQKIIERPVFSSVCVDADGLRLLDAAVAVANGERFAAPAGAAADAAEVPAR